MKSEVVALDRVRFAERRLRHHSQAKRKKLACSMERHSQLVPIVIDAEGMVIDGRARVEVARELGWTTIVAVRVEHLTSEDLRLFAIAANKFVEDAAWDLSELRVELDEIETALPTIDLTLSGFSNPEIDTLRGAHRAAELNDL
ncbi:MAG: ParB N-terminal domain-containing protein, partial [Tsuneonella sp.]